MVAAEFARKRGGGTTGDAWQIKCGEEKSV